MSYLGCIESAGKATRYLRWRKQALMQRGWLCRIYSCYMAYSYRGKT